MLSLYRIFRLNFMAKKSMIERDKKRARMVAKYAAKRAALKEAFNNAADPSKNSKSTAKSRIFPATALRPGCATVAKLLADPAATTATLVCAVTSSGIGLTKACSPAWLNPVGNDWLLPQWLSNQSIIFLIFLPR